MAILAMAILAMAILAMARPHAARAEGASTALTATLSLSPTLSRCRPRTATKLTLALTTHRSPSP
eukprot:scaffold26929_cov69-Phaeocystis_antarctica.AAC.1